MNKFFKTFSIKLIGLYINLLSYIFPEQATKLAYKFFSEPRDGRLKPESIPEILKQAEIETVSLENYNFPIYKWKGNETKILLVHGWESNASRWEPMFPYLQKSGATILAIDGPAHGLSSGVECNVPQYADFINTVFQKYEPQILIGHSLGGLTCLYFQHQFKAASLQKMVLLGAPSDLEVIIQNYANLLQLNKKVIQLMHTYFLNRFKINPVEFTGTNLASSLSVLGILSHDADDEAVHFGESKKIASGWKNATFIETKGLGHSMHDKALYQQIEKFLFSS
ncbi:alpha/beta hydrolase [Flavobacterium azooxidireducens]|uniref:Alpha/beta hydrolase n=1 Tax=Flavobacterium azooxidireducens TaxID=1871076 RepID=A0ABY4KBD1_9FLAO|nr:alpha/beta hydrolase [Flavobacterium azooxidireducens]UPQ78108.1 alpha/beta hydrolase [Flavobacterium azooxidireducens]